MSYQPTQPPLSGSLDRYGCGDHDVAYVFGRLPSAAAPFPFSTRELARLMILRSRVQSGAAYGEDGFEVAE